ncbi:hypothetical protein DPMN_062738 [Dreissena polymorpha]|uniref:Uncharacterized protein n=1 Tax=Dreissena polymorpha TaxID=45954 RepID=A0A9D4HJI7_DREPO|nr:hypothetical protein DPMN_062738 [Dreissena polymorpha]
MNWLFSPTPTNDAEKDTVVTDNSPHHQQRQEQGVQDQRIQQYTHHSPMRGGGQLHLSWQHSVQPGRNGCRCQNPHQ